MMFLTNVFNPKLADWNYALIAGVLPNLENLDDLGVVGDIGIYAKTLVCQKLYQIDWNGDVTTKIVDRGEWSRATAISEKPYRYVVSKKKNPNQTKYNELEQHQVWHNGCKWGCLKDKTTDEPVWNSKNWNLLEGDRTFYVIFESSNGWRFYLSNIDTVIYVSVIFANTDIIGDLLAQEGTVVTWTRQTKNTEEDKTWRPKYDGNASRVHITREDMGSDWGMTYRDVTFKCEIVFNENGSAKNLEQKITIKL